MQQSATRHPTAAAGRGGRRSTARRARRVRVEAQVRREPRAVARVEERPPRVANLVLEVPVRPAGGGSPSRPCTRSAACRIPRPPTADRRRPWAAPHWARAVCRGRRRPRASVRLLKVGARHASTPPGRGCRARWAEAQPVEPRLAVSERGRPLADHHRQHAVLPRGGELAASHAARRRWTTCGMSRMPYGAHAWYTWASIRRRSPGRPGARCSCREQPSPPTFWVAAEANVQDGALSRRQSGCRRRERRDLRHLVVVPMRSSSGIGRFGCTRRGPSASARSPCRCAPPPPRWRSGRRPA